MKVAPRRAVPRRRRKRDQPHNQYFTPKETAAPSPRKANADMPPWPHAAVRAAAGVAGAAEAGAGDAGNSAFTQIARFKI